MSAIAPCIHDCLIQRGSAKFYKKHNGSSGDKREQGGFVLSKEPAVNIHYLFLKSVRAQTHSANTRVQDLQKQS
jgi:hypothetical protein